MIETKLEIPTIDTETLFLAARRDGRFPREGVPGRYLGYPSRQGYRYGAGRLAEKGFAVLMPNVFHRYSRITPDGFEPGKT